MGATTPPASRCRKDTSVAACLITVLQIDRSKNDETGVDETGVDKTGVDETGVDEQE